MKIGIVGYSSQSFDQAKATQLLIKALLEDIGVDQNTVIVSGYTDLGIPNLAYTLALIHGWKTVGIACAKAKDYECFPCDEVQIVGENWGEESETFLNYIDVLVRVGGGKQSFAEVKRAKELGIPTFEYELEAFRK